MQSTWRLGAGMATLLATVLLIGGCSVAKTGALGPDAPDIVTVVSTVTGGATTVYLDHATLDALTAAGIALTPEGAASVSGSAVSFPITSGYAEIHRDHDAKPGWIQGSLDHETSGLDLASGSKVMQLTDFVVDPGDSMLYATVDGKVGVPLLFLDGTQVTDSVNSAGQVVLTGTVADLTSTAVGAIDSTFGLSGSDAIPAGTTLGTVGVQISTGNPLPAGASALTNTGLGLTTYNASKDKVTAIPRLTGTSTTLTLEPQVASALSSAGIAATPTGSATASGAAITFPITGGMVAIHSNRGFQPGYVVGTVLHQGSGITFASSSASLALSDFVVNPGTSVLTGTVGGSTAGVPLFFLDGSNLTVTPTASGATLDGTVAQLTQPAAQALNKTFGVSTFTPGMAIGTVHLVATGS